MGYQTYINKKEGFSCFTFVGYEDNQFTYKTIWQQMFSLISLYYIKNHCIFLIVILNQTCCLVSMTNDNICKGIFVQTHYLKSIPSYMTLHISPTFLQTIFFHHYTFSSQNAYITLNEDKCSYIPFWYRVSNEG